MSRSALAAVLGQLRGKLAAQQRNEQSDEQLLHAFTSRRDDDAFAVLVHRHGPMVMHVCRRVLEHEQDAEDAFQAVFLVLAQRAASLRKKTALAGFLHGTAYRTALKAKQSAARRRKHEEQTPLRSPVDPCDELSWREVRALLDEEIARLPEIYRSVFVLCCLEGLSRAESAQRLDLKECTVLSRLVKARKRLAQRLGRRGVELTAVLAATGLATVPASALSPLLISSTAKAALAMTAGEGPAGIVSASVASLVKNSSPLFGSGKAKIAVVLLIAGLGTAGAGMATHRVLLAQNRRQADEETSRQAEDSLSRSVRLVSLPPQKAGSEQAQAVTVRGRVLLPDGRPAAGARLYWPQVRKEWRRFEKDFMAAPRGVADSQGRFQFELSPADVRAARNLPLAAAADGYGVAGADLPRGKSAVELTLRLVEDQPIRGRIVNTEGKPLAGIRVSVLEAASTEDRLDAFLMGWKQYWNQILALTVGRTLYVPAEMGLLSVTTDSEGRFQIRGAGRERVVVLRVNGPGIAQGLLHVINRAGFNPEPYYRALRQHYPSDGLARGFPPLLCGPTIDYVADPSRPIEGVVRAAGSGKPVAGATVWSEANFLDAVRTVSDAQGRYRLDGLAKNKRYFLGVDPGQKDRWLPAMIQVTDSAGWQPLRADFELVPGVVVRGQLIDRASGKGVPGGVHCIPLLGNKYFGSKPGYDRYLYGWMQMPTDAEGRFRTVVIPGLSVLAANTYDNGEKIDGLPVNLYKAAEFDPDDRKRVFLIEEKGGFRYFLTADKPPDNRAWLSNTSAVKILDLAEDAGPVTCNLSVDRGKTLTVHVQDSDGKPLPGAIGAGLTDSGTHVFPLKEASCTVYALDPKRPRQLAFFHPGRRLAGTLTVRGDEKEAPVVRLVPTGTVTGRILDAEGQPLAGVKVTLMEPNRTTAELIVSELNQYLALQHEPIHTDKDGRFRWEGVFPGQEFYLGLKRGHTYLDSEPRHHTQRVKPGATLDLGGVRTTPLGNK